MLGQKDGFPTIVTGEAKRLRFFTPKQFTRDQLKGLTAVTWTWDVRADVATSSQSMPDLALVWL